MQLEPMKSIRRFSSKIEKTCCAKVSTTYEIRPYASAHEYNCCREITTNLGVIMACLFS